jgi:hypothetical protein
MATVGARAYREWYQIDTMEGMAMTLRTDDELDAALAELAEREGISKQEVVRRAVLERRDRTSHRARVDAIVSDVLVDYAEALDRLGSV